MRVVLPVVLLLAVLAAGCVQSTSQQAELLKSTDATFVASVRIVTVLKAAGAFTPQEVNDINVIIHRTQEQLHAQAAYLKDPCSTPPPDWFNASTNGIKRILEHTRDKGQGVKK
jgi:hypothetical protein